MDPNGYLGANAQPSNPGVDLLPLGYAPPDPNGGNRSQGLFVVNNICSVSLRNCSVGQGAPCVTATEGFCVENPLLLLGGYTPMPIFERTSLANYSVAQVGAPGGRPEEPNDPGHGHIGMLRLVVPEDATGTYAVGLNPDPSITLVITHIGEPMPGTLDLIPARITAQPALTPAAAPSLHDVIKNRYVSFVPVVGDVPLAYQVRLASSTMNPSAVGFTGWLSAPLAQANPFPTSTVVSTPVFRVWNEAVVHAGDCEIQPGASYEIRSTSDGVVFSAPLTINTVPRPSGGKDWGDITGINNGTQWTPPNGIANINEILVIRSYIYALDPIPTFQRVNLHAVSTGDSCLNAFVNTADTLMAILAVSGQPYPFINNPALCPVCP